MQPSFTTPIAPLFISDTHKHKAAEGSMCLGQNNQDSNLQK